MTLFYSHDRFAYGHDRFAYVHSRAYLTFMACVAVQTYEKLAQKHVI